MTGCGLVGIVPTMTSNLAPSTGRRDAVLGVSAAVALFASRVLWVPIADDVASYRSVLAAGTGAAMVGSVLVVVAAVLVAAVVLTSLRLRASTRVGRGAAWVLAAGELSTVAIGVLGAWAAATSSSTSVSGADVSGAIDAVGAASMLSFLGLGGGIVLAVSLWRCRPSDRTGAVAAVGLGAAQVTVGGPVGPVVLAVGALAAVALGVAVVRPRPVG